MRNIAVDDKFEEELHRRKEFFREKYDIEIYGTRITKAIAQLLQSDILFPLNEEGLLNILEIRKRKKVKNLQITFKMNLPVTNNYKNNKIVLSQNWVCFKYLKWVTFLMIAKNNRRLQFIISSKEAKRIEREAKRLNKSISRYLKELFIGRRRWIREAQE